VVTPLDSAQTPETGVKIFDLGFDYLTDVQSGLWLLTQG